MMEVERRKKKATTTPHSICNKAVATIMSTHEHLPNASHNNHIGLYARVCVCVHFVCRWLQDASRTFTRTAIDFCAFLLFCCCFFFSIRICAAAAAVVAIFSVFRFTSLSNFSLCSYSSHCFPYYVVVAAVAVVNVTTFELFCCCFYILMSLILSFYAYKHATYWQCNLLLFGLRFVSWPN